MDLDYTNFDNNILEYDLTKYNFSEWALSKAQEIYPIQSLETLHKEVDLSTLNKIQKHVQDSCDSLEFKEMLDNFLIEYIEPLVGGKEFLIQRYGTLRAVIPNQQAAGRQLAFHQGIFVGNGKGLRTIWTPFTSCWGTNTMQMCDYGISKEITIRSINEKWSQEYFNDFSYKASFPVELNPGQSFLFNQECIHGNVNNDTDITRVSMDLRILLKDEDYGRKYPGQYFRKTFDWVNNTPKVSTENKTYVTYAGWNSDYTQHLPLLLQRSIINNYCSKHSIEFNDYQFENEFLDHMPALSWLIDNKGIDGIVMLSIYALPNSLEDRIILYTKAIETNTEIHFAQEDIVFTGDYKLIEDYLTWGMPYTDILTEHRL